MCIVLKALNSTLLILYMIFHLHDLVLIWNFRKLYWLYHFVPEIWSCDKRFIEDITNAYRSNMVIDCLIWYPPVIDVSLVSYWSYVGGMLKWAHSNSCWFSLFKKLQKKRKIIFYLLPFKSRESFFQALLNT